MKSTSVLPMSSSTMISALLTTGRGRLSSTSRLTMRARARECVRTNSICRDRYSSFMLIPVPPTPNAAKNAAAASRGSLTRTAQTSPGSMPMPRSASAICPARRFKSAKLVFSLPWTSAIRSRKRRRPVATGWRSSTEKVRGSRNRPSYVEIVDHWLQETRAMIVRGPPVCLPSSLLRTCHTFGWTSGESPSRHMVQVL